MKSNWSSEKAFNRNLGLIAVAEQQRMSESLVVIPGCGGIGSTVAETLARLGVGRFRLCDPDSFDIANFNRQMGATIASVGMNKAEATRQRILSINPHAEVEIFSEPVSSKNAEQFVAGASVVLDGIDFFVLGARRALFKAAADAGIPAITAAPLGFSATLHVFLPALGLSFDDYFNFRPEDSTAELITKFLVGLAPKALQRPYMDMSFVDVANQTGPSSIIGTQLAATLIGGTVVKLLLDRGGVSPAPWFCQFDGYRLKWVKRYLMGGNRHPMQRFKIQLVKKGFQKNGHWDAFAQLSVS